MSTPAELEQNIEDCEAMCETLEEHHLHKFVVFHDAGLVGSFDSFHNAAREAVRRLGQGPYLIPERSGSAIETPFDARFSHTPRTGGLPTC